MRTEEVAGEDLKHFVREVWRIFFLTMVKLNIHLNVEVKYLTLNLGENIPRDIELCGNGFEFVLYCSKKLGQSETSL